jgi:hypothetical protein
MSITLLTLRNRKDYALGAFDLGEPELAKVLPTRFYRDRLGNLFGLCGCGSQLLQNDDEVVERYEEAVCCGYPGRLLSNESVARYAKVSI